MFLNLFELTKHFKNNWFFIYQDYNFCKMKIDYPFEIMYFQVI